MVYYENCCWDAIVKFPRWLHRLHINSEKTKWLILMVEFYIIYFVLVCQFLKQTSRSVTTAIQEASCNVQGWKLQQNPITAARQECNKFCKTWTTLADLISIILYKHNIMHKPATCANHRVASAPVSGEVNTVDNMEQFRRLSDREIEHFIEL